jgi:hypothetical protein
MKTASLIASLALVFAAGSALAQEATVEGPVAVGAASRAAVSAEAAQAVRAGAQHEIRAIETAFANPALRSREAVRAEAVAALRSGEIDRVNAEAWGFDRQLPSADAIRLARAAR